MNKAQKRARRILRKYKSSAAQIDVHKIVKAEKLTIDEWSFRGRVKEVYLGDSIGLNRNTKPRKKRELLAHALGHHFLHAGNHLYFEENDQFTVFNQEYEADCFAAELLLPREIFKQHMHLTIKQIADHFDVERSLVKFHLKTFLGKVLWQ